MCFLAFREDVKAPMTAQIISLDDYRLKLPGGETRTPWEDFPPIFIFTPLKTASNHKLYEGAKKQADLEAGYFLAKDVIPDEKLEELRSLIGSRKPYIVPVHAIEQMGTNSLPAAVAAYVAHHLGLEIWGDVVQANRPQRTDKPAYYRLVNFPFFDGYVEKGSEYIILDDTLAMGGTLASLRGYIESKGGKVILGVALTGHEGAANIRITEKMLSQILAKHGEELDEWWKAKVGFGLDKLTQGEAGHLRKAPSLEEIRSRISES